MWLFFGDETEVLICRFICYFLFSTLQNEVICVKCLKVYSVTVQKFKSNLNSFPGRKSWYLVLSILFLQKKKKSCLRRGDTILFVEVGQIFQYLYVALGCM